MGYIRSLMRVLKQNFTSFRSMIGLHILQDIFVDITGHEIDWYDKEDGWTEDRRKKIWNTNIITLDQSENLPAYTKSGYKKMSTPTELHNLILKTLKMKSTKYIDEELNEDDTIRNCQRINPDGSIGNDYIRTYLKLPQINSTFFHDKFLRHPNYYISIHIRLFQSWIFFRIVL